MFELVNVCEFVLGDAVATDPSVMYQESLIAVEPTVPKHQAMFESHSAIMASGEHSDKFNTLRTDRCGRENSPARF